MTEQQQNRKLLRQEKVLYDLKQTRLTENGIKKNDFKYVKLDIAEELKGKTILCPFCLHYNKFFDYWNNRKDKRLMKCPKCQNLMQIETLQKMTVFTVQQFTKFVYDYRLSRFFDKIDFKNWNNRLYKLNISQEFWDEYKKLRGDYEE